LDEVPDARRIRRRKDKNTLHSDMQYIKTRPDMSIEQFCRLIHEKELINFCYGCYHAEPGPAR
jgi:hypothetical protein